ncbi:MAG: ATP-dependent Clp protease ATP-binding subunit, partial [Clostridia bacterium]|nr:ATP-dependent Clp protease ATP-binding subunit [Clostridia bacterium]
IVMTTNAGSGRAEALGFANSQRAQNEERTKKALLEFLRPEFLNRIDEIITFSSLPLSVMEEIARLLLSDLAASMAESSMTLLFSDEVCRFAAKESYNEKYGARALRRWLQKNVEDTVATLIVSTYENPPKTIELNVADGRITANKKD